MARKIAVRQAEFFMAHYRRSREDPLLMKWARPKWLQKNIFS